MAHQQHALLASWFCAVYFGTSFVTVEPANARHDLTSGADRLSATTTMLDLRLRSTRQRLESQPSGDSELNGAPGRQSLFYQFGNGKFAVAPQCPATSCIIAKRVGADLVGGINDLVPSDSTIFTTSSPLNQSSFFVGSSWFIVATLLLVGTALNMPCPVVLWFFGLAGFLVGGTSSVLQLSWQFQLITFATLGIALVVLWQRLDQPSRNGNDVGDQPFSSGHPHALVGRVLRLQKPVVDGIGVVTIGGTMWRVAGGNCSAGKLVKVIDAQGTLLIVNPLDV